MRVQLDKKADKAIDKLGIKEGIEIRNFIKNLTQTSSFYDSNFEKLRGNKLRYKIRIGNYRIVVKKITNTHIQITAIAHRKDIYRSLFGVTF